MSLAPKEQNDEISMFGLLRTTNVGCPFAWRKSSFGSQRKRGAITAGFLLDLTLQNVSVR